MKPRLFRFSMCFCAALLSACAGRHAPDISGRWKPVNRLSTTTTAIPLHTDYTYQVSPMDGTLKTLLERWARDTGLTLDYGIDRDYTVIAALAQLQTIDRSTALAELARAYQVQGLQLTATDGQLRVRASAVTAAP